MTEGRMAVRMVAQSKPECKEFWSVQYVAHLSRCISKGWTLSFSDQMKQCLTTNNIHTKAAQIKTIKVYFNNKFTTPIYTSIFNSFYHFGSVSSSLSNHFNPKLVWVSSEISSKISELVRVAKKKVKYLTFFLKQQRTLEIYILLPSPFHLKRKISR